MSLHAWHTEQWVEPPSRANSGTSNRKNNHNYSDKVVKGIHILAQVLGVFPVSPSMIKPAWQDRTCATHNKQMCSKV